MDSTFGYYARQTGSQIRTTNVNVWNVETVQRNEVTLRIRVKVPHALHVGHEPLALRGVEAERREDLRRLPVLLHVHEARVGVVLQEAVPVRVAPGDEPLHGEHGPLRPVRELDRVRADEVDLLGGVGRVVLLGPAHGLVLQCDVGEDRVGTLLAGVDLPPLHVALGDVVAGAAPAVGVEAMVGCRLRRRRKLLHLRLWHGHFFGKRHRNAKAIE